MARSQVEPITARFEFINATTVSGGERRRNTYLARAHAARINRQKYSTQTETNQAKHERALSLLPKPTCTPSDTEEDDIEEIDQKGNYKPAQELQPFQIKPGYCPLKGTGLPAVARSNEQTILRAISPVYGGLSTTTFDLQSGPISAQLGQYLLKVSWPCMGGSTETSKAWFKAFCLVPIIFHVSHICASVHHDVLVGKAEWSESAEVLYHKTRAIQMVSDGLGQLSTLNQCAIEQLIFAVASLSRHELEPKHLVNDEILLFDPHMPLANHMKPLGRFKQTLAARNVLVQLVDAQGGLRNLKLLGLADILAIIDILEASYDLAKPRHACFWETNVSDLLRLDIYPGMSNTRFGRGFCNVPGGLPQNAVDVFSDLAIVDTMMTLHDNAPQDGAITTILAARNSSIHRLLSLPPWEELDVAEKGQTDLVVYELARLTVNLYSNAVLLGVPPHNGWHRRLVERMRSLLEVCDPDTWAEDVSGFWIWVMFVGGIASYRSAHRTFFEASLCDLLLRLGLQSWDTVQKGLQHFLWADTACKHGAAVLWDNLALGER